MSGSILAVEGLFGEFLRVWVANLSGLRQRTAVPLEGSNPAQCVNREEASRVASRWSCKGMEEPVKHTTPNFLFSREVYGARFYTNSTVKVSTLNA
ncbi:hypothetical protein BABINDRAFT_158968 [Babjeviella inositovora NRRL Y-12698]|uniref:Uncharacterized protein n=1 Tax=Babjeviella inositovora NRRL Y-12698 TaxID=984486 RepID=A0A1E3QXG2_9ASCO|nr:uncharacterized protein BABINDRAFT_158968 [Babjeviella inositovora NRRL Y-12698]ODQ82353.1 hypothetical protein BABINDRAFT_158968 [Babjeviella inositovora NRRL Y-12698]